MRLHIINRFNSCRQRWLKRVKSSTSTPFCGPLLWYDLRRYMWSRWPTLCLYVDPPPLSTPVLHLILDNITVLQLNIFTAGCAWKWFVSSLPVLRYLLKCLNLPSAQQLYKFQLFPLLATTPSVGVRCPLSFYSTEGELSKRETGIVIIGEYWMSFSPSVLFVASITYIWAPR